MEKVGRLGGCRVRDALEQGGLGADERQALEAIVGILQRARRSRAAKLAERTIIVLESKRRPRG